MRYSHILGIDPGLVSDPTGMVLVRVTQPAVVVSGGKVLDARTGDPITLPEGVTASEFCLPRYEVADARRRKGLSFLRIAREARATHDDLEGDLACVVDNTGLGRGATEAIRQAGVRTIAVNLTAGSKVTGGRWESNMPVSIMWSSLFAVVAQGRLKIHERHKSLAEELLSIDTKTSDSGNVTFEFGGSDHHADQACALAMATAVLEHRGQRLARAAAAAERKPINRKRPRGRTRPRGDLAKRIVEQRIDESRRASEEHMRLERERFAAAGWEVNKDAL